jgi:N-acetylglucosamine-6-phosphate deacetylase
MRAFDGLVEAAAGHLRVMTLAPELPRAESVLRAAASRDVVIAVGHTDARYEEAARAFAAGASLLTHAFNAMRPFHHRDPGPVAAAVDSPGAVVELIADGVHLHPATAGLLVRALGPQRAALVSDGVKPAGMASGGFRVGDSEARLQDGRVLLADGTIAGGAATMDQVVRNVVRWGAADLTDAVRMASGVPAAVLGLGDRKGRIAPGYDADLVALDEGLEVAMAWVGGQMRHWPKGPQG